MFAIIKTGGKQYKVEKGTKLDIERIEKKEGESFNLNQVLLISDKTATKIGTPFVEGAYVIAKIIAHKRGEKVKIFKMKAKKRYRRTKGHRQELTTIEITDIKASGGTAVPKTEKVEKTPKAETPAKVEKAPKAEKPKTEKAPKTEKPKKVKKTTPKAAPKKATK